MLRSWITAVGVLGMVGLVGVVAWAFGAFRPRLPDVPAATSTAQLEQAQSANMDQALVHIRTARDKFATVKDYRMTFLRDEVIKGEMQQNHMVMKVRHEPFSVYMEWLAPQSKKGRKTAYVEGLNNGKMLVREPIGRFAITVRLDPEESKKRGESKHTIKEAGYRNLVERYVKSWEKEKELGKTKVTIQEGELKVAMSDGDKTFNCIVVTTHHEPKDKEHFTFYRSRMYFNKETGQLVRLEGYDWPARRDDKEGELIERYTYLNVETNVGLTDGDFKF
jgi:uncharacterized protein DUF1571